MHARLPRLFALPAAAALLLLAPGCPSQPPAAPPPEPATPPPFTMLGDLVATVVKESSFYRSALPATLPAGLKWQNGQELPEFADPGAKKGSTFRTFIPDFPRTLRTIGPDAAGGIRSYLHDDTAVAFVHPHPNIAGATFPGLAEAWAAGADGRTFYFRLHPAARWSDGMPVTTDDVLFSLYLFRGPHIRDPWYNNFYRDNFEAVTLFDARTFALTLRQSRPDGLLRAGHWVPYPKHAMHDFGPDFVEKFQWRPLPTTGAYFVRETEIDKGRALTLTRVADWWARDLRFWRGRFNPDRYRLEVIRDVDKAFESFLRGELDIFLPMTAVPRFWYDKLPSDHAEVAAGYIAKTRFFNQIPRPDWGLWINRSKPLLADRDIRLGLQHATHFQLVVDRFYRGGAARSRTFSDGYPFDANPAIPLRPFDPALARAAFARAGFDRADERGVLTNAAGQRLSFTVTSYHPPMADLLAILQAEALKAGLELNLEILDATTGWKKVHEKGHEIALAAFSRPSEHFPRYRETLHSAYASKAQTNNLTNIAIPELDQLIEAYDRATSQDEARALAGQIEQFLFDDAAWIPGWHVPFYRLASWRWVKWPAAFNARQSASAEELFLHWIDEDTRRETEQGRREGRRFPVQVHEFVQFRSN